MDRPRPEQPQPEPRETERRQAAVLFADLTGFTTLVEQAGDEEAYALVTSCLKRMDAIARRHGATVDKYLGDCIMAVFGVPKAIEFAPHAAVNAAIEMREDVRRFNEEKRPERPLEVHTGICYGRLISGDVSGPVIREFAVMGDTVNIAARLRDAAPPGHVYVGPETWLATRDAFDYVPRGETSLKGKQNQVEIYELRSTTPVSLRRAPGSRLQVQSELVGRDDELSALRLGVAAAAAGQGNVLTLIGEPGLGKSRLLEELRRAPECSGMTWLEGHALAQGGSMSFHPFSELLRNGLSLGSDLADPQALERLREAAQSYLADGVEDAVPLLATLLGMPLPPEEQARVESIQAEVRQKRTRKRVTEMLAGMAAVRPLVVALDDLHWADASSLDLLEALLPLARSHPLLFLLIARPGYESTSERLRHFVADQLPERVATVLLEPLDGNAVARLLDNVFAGGDVPRRLRQAIEARVDGNPFFAEEVVRALLEDGSLTEREGHLFATADIEPSAIPNSVEEVLMSRVDRLDPASKNILQVASVIGQRFALRILSEVQDKNGLEGILAGLVAAGLIAPSPTRDEEYLFAHPLIQEVTYQTILRARRRELHLRVGEAMEQLLTQNAPGYNALLAYHFSEGRDLERGESYLFLAGDEASRTAASGEALSFFQQAARLYFEAHGDGGDPGKQAVLERSIANAQFNRGNLPEALEHYGAALSILGDRPPSSGLAAYLRFGFDLVAVLRRLYLPNPRPRVASDTEREIIAIRFKRALAQTTTDSQFVFDTLATLRMLVRVDPASVPESGGILAGADGIFAYSGVSFAIGRRVLDVAAQWAAAGELDELLVYYRFMNFLHHYLEGDWSDEHGIDPLLLAEGIRRGHFWEVSTFLDLDCGRLLRMGELERAEENIRQLQLLVDEHEHGMALSALRSRRASLALARGDFAAARELARAHRGARDEPALRLVGLGVSTDVELAAGELERAEAFMAEAGEVFGSAGLLPPYHRSFYLANRFRLDVALLEAAGPDADRGLHKRARRSRRRALPVAPKVAARRVEILRSAARHDWLRRRYRSAARYFARAVAAAEALGARPDLAQTCREIAARLGEDRGPDEIDGRNARAWLERAAELDG